MSTITQLMRQRMRSDRWQLLMWIAGTALLAASAVIGVSSSYGDMAERQALLQTVAANPVIMLFRGLPSGPEESAVMLFLILPWLSMMAAFMSLFLAVRHTRADEEQGRTELLGGAAPHRSAALTATLLHGITANAVLGIVIAAVYVGMGYDPAGALVSGAATASVGLVFVAVGLVTAQLFSTSRAANALGVWILLGTFVITGVGNALGTPNKHLTRITSAPLAWFSPFGWAEQTRPFDTNNAWPLLLCVAGAGILVAVSYALHARRDLGLGVIHQRNGRAHAAAWLRSGSSLTWRLSRGSFIGWAVGALLTGILATGLASVVREAGAKVPSVQKVLDALSGGGAIDRGMVIVFYVMVGFSPRVPPCRR